MGQEGKRIVFYHLLNNFTGSPKVLAQVISGFVDLGYSVDLITNRSVGLISNLKGVNYKHINYKVHRNKFVMLLFFLRAQFDFFYISIRDYRNVNCIFYINTILPIGGAIAGRVLNKKVVYHVHEHFFANTFFYRLLTLVLRNCASKVIFVSNYVRDVYRLKLDTAVIYNTLDLNFQTRVTDFRAQGMNQKEVVLMISSLKEYKGVFQFIKLCFLLPHISFELVLSCSQGEKEKLIEGNHIPSNLTIFSSQIDLHDFYQRALLCVNLSLPNKWIETFGLTILEAMTYGIPVVVPPVGGIVELVDDGVNGFCVDARDLVLLKNRISQLLTNKELYEEFSRNSLEKSKSFSYEDLIRNIEQVVLY